MSKRTKKVGILTSNATILPILTIDAVATQPFFYSFCQSKSFSIIPILQATLVFVIILKKKLAHLLRLSQQKTLLLQKN